MSNIFRSRTDFDDLIFEHRNKDYGAYMIRKVYNLNVIISILIASFLFSVFVVFPYLEALGKMHGPERKQGIHFIELKMEKMDPPKENIIIPPAPPPPANATASIKYIAPTVVDTVSPFEKQLPTVSDVIASNPASDNLLVAGTGNPDELITGQEGDKSDEPFMIVEVRPTFKGGDIEKFREWVQKQAIYPQIAQENRIHGKVILTFIIERDGSVSNVKVVQSVDKLLDDEAVKAIQASPKWSPGLQRGIPVRVRYYIPLIFALPR
jgi:periplasmic protein TonB